MTKKDTKLRIKAILSNKKLLFKEKADMIILVKEERRSNRAPIAKPQPKTVFVKTEIGAEKRESGRFTKRYYKENYA